MNAIKEARYNLGIAYLNDAQYKEAISEFQAVIKLDADFIEAHCGLSRAYLELNELANAEKTALAALSLNSNYPDALSQIDAIKNFHYDNGITLLNEKRYHDAVSTFQKVETLDPDYKDIHFNLGRAHLGLKEYDNAISSLQNALTSDSISDDVHYFLGCAYVEQRQFDTAIQHLEQAIKSDPNNIDAHYNLARAYRELGNLEAATNAASETLRLDPNYQPIHDLVETIKQTHYNRGIAYLNEDRYSDAVAAFHNVVALNSDFTAAHFNLGMAYLKMENYPRAIDVLQKTVTLDHTHKTAFHALALAYFGQHELENARNAAKDALKIDLNFQPARSLLEAIDPSFSHKPTPSTTDTQNTTQLDLDIVDEQHIEDTVSVQNKDDQSKPEEVEKDTQETPKVEKDLVRGSVFLNNKQYNQAAVAFKRVIKADPKSVEAFYGLGQVYLGVNAYEDAETAANEALKLNPKHQPSRELLQVIKYVKNHERNKKIWKKVFIYTSIVLIFTLGLFVTFRFGVIKIPDFSQPKPKLSIIPSIDEPSGNCFIDAGETAQLKLIISNSGGNAKNVLIRLTPKSISGLHFQNPKYTIEVNTGKQKTYKIPITADKNVKAMEKTLKIQLIGENEEDLATREFQIKTQPHGENLKPIIVE